MTDTPQGIRMGRHRDQQLLRISRTLTVFPSIDGHRPSRGRPLHFRGLSPAATPSSRAWPRTTIRSPGRWSPSARSPSCSLRALTSAFAPRGCGRCSRASRWCSSRMASRCPGGCAGWEWRPTSWPRGARPGDRVARRAALGHRRGQRHHLVHPGRL